jgi:WD40 repeat protein
MVSCGEDKNWMIWDVQNEKNYENKGMISGLHSRAIYSCSWSKGKFLAADGHTDLSIDLIATVSKRL